MKAMKAGEVASCKPLAAGTQEGSGGAFVKNPAHDCSVLAPSRDARSP